MKPYTVVMTYPENIAGEDFGHDFYQAHVTAEDIPGAIELGQDDAVALYADESEDNDPTDFAVVCVYDGHLADRSGKLR